MIPGRRDGCSLHLQDLLLVHLLYIEVEDESGPLGRRGERWSVGSVHVILRRHGKVHAQLLMQLPAKPRLQRLLVWLHQTEAVANVRVKGQDIFGDITLALLFSQLGFHIKHRKSFVLG